jgi:hypothetical protein
MHEPDGEYYSPVIVAGQGRYLLRRAHNLVQASGAGVGATSSTGTDAAAADPDDKDP